MGLTDAVQPAVQADADRGDVDGKRKKRAMVTVLSIPLDFRRLVRSGRAKVHATRSETGSISCSPNAKRLFTAPSSHQRSPLGGALPLRGFKGLEHVRRK